MSGERENLKRRLPVLFGLGVGQGPSTGIRNGAGAGGPGLSIIHKVGLECYNFLKTNYRGFNIQNSGNIGGRADNHTDRNQGPY